MFSADYSWVDHQINAWNAFALLGSTVVSPYVGMARKQNGGYNASISVQTLIFHLVVNSTRLKTVRSALWRCPNSTVALRLLENERAILAKTSWVYDRTSKAQVKRIFLQKVFQRGRIEQRKITGMWSMSRNKDFGRIGSTKLQYRVWASLSEINTRVTVQMVDELAQAVLT